MQDIWYATPEGSQHHKLRTDWCTRWWHNNHNQDRQGCLQKMQISLTGAKTNIINERNFQPKAWSKYVKNRKKWGCIFTMQWVHEVSIITFDSIQIIIWVYLNSSLKTAEQEKPELFTCLIWRFTQIYHPTSNMKNKSIQN